MRSQTGRLLPRLGDGPFARKNLRQLESAPATAKIPALPDPLFQPAGDAVSPRGDAFTELFALEVKNIPLERQPAVELNQDPANQVVTGHPVELAVLPPGQELAGLRQQSLERLERLRLLPAEKLEDLAFYRVPTFFKRSATGEKTLLSPGHLLSERPHSLRLLPPPLLRKLHLTARAMSESIEKPLHGGIRASRGKQAFSLVDRELAA